MDRVTLVVLPLYVAGELLLLLLVEVVDVLAIPTVSERGRKEIVTSLVVALTTPAA